MSANTSGFLQVETDPAKQWAKGFDTLKVFDQIVVLHNLFVTALSFELKLQLLNLLNERVLQYYESLSSEELKIKQQLGIATKVQVLTCRNKDEKTNLLCGLPKNHTQNPLTTRHQNGNVYW